MRLTTKGRFAVTANLPLVVRRMGQVLCITFDRFREDTGPGSGAFIVQDRPIMLFPNELVN